MFNLLKSLNEHLSIESFDISVGLGLTRRFTTSNIANVEKKKKVSLFFMPE